MVRLARVGLAWGMVGRVHGVARQARYKKRDRLDERGLLEAFGVTSAEALAERALTARLGGAWCGGGQRASVLAALAEVPGARERALERARAALRGEYHVFGTRVCFGEGQPVDWSLDVGSGYRYPVVPVERLTLTRPGVDPKYPWELGRLDCLVALGQGYWVASEEEARRAFARGFVARALDFLQANPVGEGVQWTCPMDVALRGANLAQALWMFSDAPEARRAEFLVPMLRSIAEHSAWVESHLEDGGAVPNNHLVSNFVGLLVMSLLFPELPDAARWTALAAAGLRAQVAAQVNADGSSFEGSIPYHRLSVELFTLALVGGRWRGCGAWIWAASMSGGCAACSRPRAPGPRNRVWPRRWGTTTRDASSPSRSAIRASRATWRRWAPRSSETRPSRAATSRTRRQGCWAGLDSSASARCGPRRRRCR